MSRTFLVWARCNHRDGPEQMVEMSDDATDEECEKACADAIDTLIGNEFDTGWNELSAEELAARKRGRK